MHSPLLPERGSCKEHILNALSLYWPTQPEYIAGLPVFEKKNITIKMPLKLAEITLPDWGSHCGVNGIIMVPLEVCNDPNEKNWQKVDWWMGAFILLEAWHERVYEMINGPIHSYSFRLKRWDTRAWDYAWVNRIGMFLRSWAAQIKKESETTLFGEIPECEVIITHDVDAVAKTLPIRLKQSAFNFFNFLRSIYNREWKNTLPSFKKSLTLLLGTDNWWKLDEVLQIEKESGIKSHFNFYADSRKKTLKRWLFDPSYDIADEKLGIFIMNALKDDFIIGLHPTYDAWESEGEIYRQLHLLEEKTKNKITTCRQHWLRFSWNKTWEAQEKSGIKLDTTIMFNDRPGFRLSIAIPYQPWNAIKNSEHSLYSLPTVLMDSHLYDYKSFTDKEREIQMNRWINEIKNVHGIAAVLWHPHTLSRDYGWQKGFTYLVNLIAPDK